MVYPVPLAFDHTSIKISQFPGLLCFHVFVDTAGARLVTFWTNRDAYTAAQAVFAASLPAGAAPDWEGLQREAKAQAPTFRQRLW